MSEIPFHILKEVITIRDSKHFYEIDEDGYGYGVIGNYRVTFQIDEYGDLLIETIRCHREN